MEGRERRKSREVGVKDRERETDRQKREGV